MARLARITLPAYPHHLMQRGNNRQAIFFTEADYHYYLACLHQAKQQCQCRLYAYVLMTNHVHLLVEPTHMGGLGRLMQSVGRRYVRYINVTYQRSGTLWEGRFKSAAVDRDAYLIMCSRYVELNPVRAGMVPHPRDYPWSSYQYRALGIADALLDDDPWYGGLGASPQQRQQVYREWMDASIASGEWEDIRRATQRARVIGTDAFQREIEAQIGRRVRGETRGRPRKALMAG